MRQKPSLLPVTACTCPPTQAHDTHNTNCQTKRSVHVPADVRAGLGVSSHSSMQVLLRTTLGLSQGDQEHNHGRQHPEGQQHQAADPSCRHACSCTARGAWEALSPPVKASALLRGKWRIPQWREEGRSHWSGFCLLWSTVTFWRKAETKVMLHFLFSAL